VLSIRQILVPIDFTETSDKAFDYALELAKKFGAAITAMHAYQIPVYGFPDGAFITSADVASQIATAAQSRLDAFHRANKDRGVPLTVVLRDGAPWEEVNTLAAEVKADLVVIGTHGRKGLARALLGSVAENVIRTASVPVLAIHGPRDVDVSRPPVRGPE
jgi:nucleotide-binding universal stress UspA family protein